MTVTVHRDVVYSRPPGYRPLSLDLYVPAGQARALCLYLHGGGWRVGSRADGPGTARDWTPSFFERVAAMGLAMASLDYRLSGEARWPAQLEDVEAAATFLSLQRKPLGVPTPRTVAWGVSAGGQLAAMHALCSADAGLDAVVCWYPPTDLDALAGDCDEAGGHGERGPQARESQLLGAPVGERPDLAAAASPVRFAQPQRAPVPVAARHRGHPGAAAAEPAAGRRADRGRGAGHGRAGGRGRPHVPGAGRGRDDAGGRALGAVPVLAGERLTVRHDHVGINVADLARAEAWYAAAFGLKREFATRIDAVDLDIVMLRDAEHGHRVELLHRPRVRPRAARREPGRGRADRGVRAPRVRRGRTWTRSTAGCSASAPGR